ncbi:flavoprotein [Neocallimastix sp. 'constans']
MSLLFKDSRKIVITYSRADENYPSVQLEVGNTERLGDMIIEYTHADKHHIEPAKPYPKGYKQCCDQALEEKNQGARPAVANQLENLDNYDTIFFGYPIWWGDLPMPAYTFIEKLNFEGKTVIPFCTHEGSGNSNTFNSLKRKMKGAKFLKGIEIQGNRVDGSKEMVNKWLSAIGF